jgi:hypothetical protein
MRAFEKLTDGNQWPPDLAILREKIDKSRVVVCLGGLVEELGKGTEI